MKNYLFGDAYENWRRIILKRFQRKATQFITSETIAS